MIRSLFSMSVSDIIAYILAVVLAISVHEMAHALVSYAFGDPTARRMGRLSLNPFSHIDWSGMLCLLLFGFGWAKPVPIDSRYYRDEKTGIIWTSFAGPMANFLLSFVCIFIYYGMLLFMPQGLLMNWFFQFILQLLSLCALLSCGFGIFNLIPVPPLDGSKIFWAFLPDDQYYKMMHPQPWIYILFMVLMVSGIISGPLGIMRNTLIDWMSQASLWIFSLFM